MSRFTAFSTVVGLLGLATAMLSALASQPPAGLLVLGLASMGFGMLGAVIGAAAAVRLVPFSTR
ncbi:hypothetical protein SAMN05444279_12551 [Ruegeria intermedia]|uniref:Uncharacterized protein n=1 Tax=Ruegeria intermedia TaxID=996115 RepID=A0A1M5AF31_9RHOB|nr:hypothetical protein [Ruegeria intermedia]SHF28910.1 hypothetical protein SAMN05444279_12551 [Ruegeria intermedia]